MDPNTTYSTADVKRTGGCLMMGECPETNPTQYSRGGEHPMSRTWTIVTVDIDN